MLVREAQERLFQWFEPFTPGKITRDALLAGDPDQEVRGIAVCICATMEALEQASALGANLVITHEDIFFGGRLDHERLQSDEVYLRKKRFIEEKGLSAVRLHDRMHGNGLPFHPARVRRDYIFWGICQELGWEQYVVGDPLKPERYEIPPVSARELAHTFIDAFQLDGMRCVGALDVPVSRIWFSSHAMGDRMDAEVLAKAKDTDIFVPFEICDFTLTQYVADAAAQGVPKAILEMGHFNCEELGMRHAASWLGKALDTDIPVHFIQVGDTYRYITR